MEAEWRFCVPSKHSGIWLERQESECVLYCQYHPSDIFEKSVFLPEQNILIKTLIWNLTRVFNRDSTSFLSSFKSALFFFPWCYIKISSIYKIILSSDFLIFSGWELWLAFYNFISNWLVLLFLAVVSNKFMFYQRLLWGWSEMCCCCVTEYYNLIFFIKCNQQVLLGLNVHFFPLMLMAGVGVQSYHHAWPSCAAVPV